MPPTQPDINSFPPKKKVLADHEFDQQIAKKPTTRITLSTFNENVMPSDLTLDGNSQEFFDPRNSLQQQQQQRPQSGPGFVQQQPQQPQQQMQPRPYEKPAKKSTGFFSWGKKKKDKSDSEKPPMQQQQYGEVQRGFAPRPASGFAQGPQSGAFPPQFQQQQPMAYEQDDDDYTYDSEDSNKDPVLVQNTDFNANFIQVADKHMPKPRDPNSPRRGVQFAEYVEMEPSDDGYEGYEGYEEESWPNQNTPSQQPPQQYAQGHQQLPQPPLKPLQFADEYPEFANLPPRPADPIEQHQQQPRMVPNFASRGSSLKNLNEVSKRFSEAGSLRAPEGAQLPAPEQLFKKASLDNFSSTEQVRLPARSNTIGSKPPPHPDFAPKPAFSLPEIPKTADSLPDPPMSAPPTMTLPAIPKQDALPSKPLQPGWMSDAPIAPSVTAPPQEIPPRSPLNKMSPKAYINPPQPSKIAIEQAQTGSQTTLVSFDEAGIQTEDSAEPDSSTLLDEIALLKQQLQESNEYNRQIAAQMQEQKKGFDKLSAQAYKKIKQLLTDRNIMEIEIKSLKTQMERLEDQYQDFDDNELMLEE